MFGVSFFNSNFTICVSKLLTQLFDEQKKPSHMYVYSNVLS